MAEQQDIEPVPGSHRDGQLRSPFTGILETLCESCHGSLAALLVDEEGETVDLASVPIVEMDGDERVVRRMGGYDIKLSGAHWQIVMRQAAEQLHLGGVSQLWVTTESHGFVLKTLHEGYALVLLCRPDTVYTVSSRALRQVEVELALEADWDIPEPSRPFWRRAKVRMDPRGRPRQLRFAAGLDGSEEQDAEAWHSVRSHGASKDIRGFEKAFEVSIGDDPSHVTLVRERTGFWFAGLRVPA